MNPTALHIIHVILKKYNKILEFKNATYFVPETTVNPSQKSHYYTREEETE